MSRVRGPVCRSSEQPALRPHTLSTQFPGGAGGIGHGEEDKEEEREGREVEHVRKRREIQRFLQRVERNELAFMIRSTMISTEYVLTWPVLPGMGFSLLQPNHTSLCLSAALPAKDLEKVEQHVDHHPESCYVDVIADVHDHPLHDHSATRSRKS